MSLEPQSRVEMLRQEVLARVGRNLLVYQSIERSLKFLVPLSHPLGSVLGDDAYERLAVELASSTLGPLVAKFQEAFQTIRDPQDVSVYLRALVRARNELVHDFLQRPVSLHDETGCMSTIAYLDDRFAEAINFQRLLESTNLEVSRALESQNQVTLSGNIDIVKVIRDRN